jgi:hypothetical protein
LTLRRPLHLYISDLDWRTARLWPQPLDLSGGPVALGAHRLVPGFTSATRSRCAATSHHR